MSLVTIHPFKFLYGVLALLFETARFPLWILQYSLPSLRPHPSFTLRKALGVTIVRRFLTHMAITEAHIPLSLVPGKEKDQFTVIQPSSASSYLGPLDDTKVKPEAIGGTWYPRVPGPNDLKDKRVLLHFHGGAFVIGDGRIADAGFAASTLVKHGGFSYVFCPQYRLAGKPTSASFPAAIIDAVTSYLYLLNGLSIGSEQITVSGDSAGGNMVLSLLRYISEFGAQVSSTDGSKGIPAPHSALLWSPWAAPHDAFNEANTLLSPHLGSDYLGTKFGIWGARRYIPQSQLSPSAKWYNYITFIGHAFRTETPLWIQTGDAEMLFHDDVKLAEEMKAVKGNWVDLEVTQGAVHDIILVGKLIGWRAEAEVAAVKAGKWVREVTKGDGSKL